MEKTEDLLLLDTKEKTGSDALARLCKIEEVGMAQYDSVVYS